MLNIQLITNGEGGNQRTFHQDHVELLHQFSFLKQRGYINDLIQSKVTQYTYTKCIQMAKCDSNLLDQFPRSIAGNVKYATVFFHRYVEKYWNHGYS